MKSNSEITIDLNWKNIDFTTNTVLTSATTPIIGITDSATYKYNNLLDTIKSEGLLSGSTN